MGIKKLDFNPNESKDAYTIVTYQHLSLELPKEYTNFIIAPFLTTLKSGNDEFKMIDRDSYFKNYKSYIYSLLFERPESKVNIAFLPAAYEKEDIALGWCLYEKNIVHYVWVKEEVRRQGICKKLLPKDFDTITHRTNVGKNIWLKNYSDAIYDPWARA